MSSIYSWGTSDDLFLISYLHTLKTGSQVYRVHDYTISVNWKWKENKPYSLKCYFSKLYENE